MKGIITIVVIIAIWQVASFAGLNPYVLPSPSDIFLAFVDSVKDGSLLKHSWASFQRVGVGIILAFCLSLPVAVTLALNRILREFLLPVIEGLRPVPPIAWIPVAILWFGVRGDAGSYFIVFIASFFPLFINTFTAVGHIEPIHINAARALGARRRHIITDIAIPSALPYLITGLRISIGVGWMSLIAAEMVVSFQGTGLGYMFQLNRDVNNPADVMVNTFTIGLIGYLMNALIIQIEKRLLLWRPVQI